MKIRQFILLVIVCIHLASCSMLFNACIRNTTNQIATIDVYILDKTNLKTLPNKIRVANRLVNLKSGYKKYLNSSEDVTWIDTEHFKLDIKPQTTVDLSDMIGAFINGSPRHEARVIVTSPGKIDTLIDGRQYPGMEKFNYIGGFFSPKLYYDIKLQDTPSTTTTISPFTDLAAK